MAHRSIKRTPEAVDMSIPRVSLDYMFMSKGMEDKMSLILVLKDWQSK